jgi:hypothetical protein
MDEKFEVDDAPGSNDILGDLQTLYNKYAVFRASREAKTTS